MQDLPNGGGGARCRPMWQGGGGANSGGGEGADPSIGPRALEALGTPIAFGRLDCTIFVPL